MNHLPILKKSHLLRKVPPKIWLRTLSRFSKKIIKNYIFANFTLVHVTRTELPMEKVKSGTFLFKSFVFFSVTKFWEIF